MKIPRSKIVCAFLLSIFFFSCTDNNKTATKTVNKGSMTVTKEYNPGSKWELAWSDEFEEDVINPQKWNLQIVEAGRFNEEWQRYTDSSENAFISDSCLVIKAMHKSDLHAMDQYTSARLNTANAFSFKYGKIAARIKLPEGEGIWPAFWMLGENIDENGGDTPWPQCGEIDILELYGSKDNAAIEANAHYANSSDAHAMMGAKTFRLPEGIFSDAFHVFELEWNKKNISWLVDGDEFASMSITDEVYSEFHNEFFVLLNIAVGGTYAGRPNETTIFPQQMLIDWVRVYKEKHK